MTGTPASGSSFEILRGLRQRTKAAEHCELCGQSLGPLHEHLIDPGARRLLCACNACACLFHSSAAAKYRRVPRRVLSLADFAITDAQWDALGIPIGLAFFLKHGADGKVSAIYPSPAGPVESLLPLDCWGEISGTNPIIGGMEPDVEAVLVNRGGAEYYLAPIDQCYRLVGLIRFHWRGLSGGTEVWREIHSFFTELRHRALPEARHA